MISLTDITRNFLEDYGWYLFLRLNITYSSFVQNLLRTRSFTENMISVSVLQYPVSGDFNSLGLFGFIFFYLRKRKSLSFGSVSGRE